MCVGNSSSFQYSFFKIGREDEQYTVNKAVLAPFSLSYGNGRTLASDELISSS